MTRTEGLSVPVGFRDRPPGARFQGFEEWRRWGAESVSLSRLNTCGHVFLFFLFCF